MSNQTKRSQQVKINKKTYQQMLNHAPSFAQSMINITTHMGVKPVSNTVTGIRQFKDKYGQVFQEMDKAKNKKNIAS